MKTNIFRFIGESLLWVVSNVISVLLPTALAFFLITEVFHVTVPFHPRLAWLYVLPFALATLTWGSWAALTWTKTRALRVGMRASTAIPGLLLSFFGLFFIKSGFGFVPGLAMVMAGIGAVALSTILSKTFGAKAANSTPVGLLAGLAAFPALATLMAAGVGSLWFQLVIKHVETVSQGVGCMPLSPLFHAERFIDLSTVMVTIMSWTLISTVIPAIASSLIQRGCKALGF